MRDQRRFEANVERWASDTLTPRLSDAIARVERRRPTSIKYFAGFGPDDFWPELLLRASFPETSESLVLDFYLGGMTHVTLTRDVSKPDIDITVERSHGFDLTALCPDDAIDCKARAVEKALKPDNFFVGWDVIWDPLFRLRRQAAGFNAGVDFHMFGRMLYLSAITVTTVGYGDIVPLTDVARTSVAFEAMLGVVLIGLFLNALAHEHGPGTPDASAGITTRG